MSHQAQTGISLCRELYSSCSLHTLVVIIINNNNNSNYITGTNCTGVFYMPGIISVNVHRHTVHLG